MEATQTLLETFRSEVEKMIRTHYKTNLALLAETSLPMITLEEGKKFVRVVRADKHLPTGNITGRAVYCFVNKENGDILKPAGWKAPAKHARGSIHNANILEGCGVYGVAYLR
jgi:hypothetical protein